MSQHLSRVKQVVYTSLAEKNQCSYTDTHAHSPNVQACVSTPKQRPHNRNKIYKNPSIKRFFFQKVHKEELIFLYWTNLACLCENPLQDLAGLTTKKLGPCVNQALSRHQVRNPSACSAQTSQDQHHQCQDWRSVH